MMKQKFVDIFFFLVLFGLWIKGTQISLIACLLGMIIWYILDMNNIDVRIFRCSYKRNKGILFLIPIWIAVSGTYSLMKSDLIYCNVDFTTLIYSCVRICIVVLFMVGVYCRLRIALIPNYICIIISSFAMLFLSFRIEMVMAGAIILLLYCKFQYIGIALLTGIVIFVNIPIGIFSLFIIVLSYIYIFKKKNGFLIFGNYFQLI